MSTERTCWTAVHEAGHALAFLRLGGGQGRGFVSIEPDADTNGRAAVSLVDGCGGDVPTEVRANEAVMCAAGFAACLVSGATQAEAAYGCAGDFDAIEALGEALQTAQQRARDLLAEPGHRRALEVFARVLLARRRVAVDLLDLVLLSIDGHVTLDQLQLTLEWQFPADAGAVLKALDESWRPREGGAA